MPAARKCTALKGMAPRCFNTIGLDIPTLDFDSAEVLPIGLPPVLLQVKLSDPFRNRVPTTLKRQRVASQGFHEVGVKME
jgi:hypothetical protein